MTSCEPGSDSRAIVKLLQILGEVTKKMSDEVRSQYSSVPWKEISGMRDILVREYRTHEEI
ncbi:MAG: DUF86 domain-containing protein [Alkalinema sp. CAN_BIN05]|nr:DUF86 domain-containing protein [Alkalinema sp. CAN_BIN05]